MRLLNNTLQAPVANEGLRLALQSGIFSLFLLFLESEQLTALIKSLKLGKKNLTLNILSYQLLGVKLLRVLYLPPCWDDTAGDWHGDSRVTLTSYVHFGMWVGQDIGIPSWIWNLVGWEMPWCLCCYLLCSSNLHPPGQLDQSSSDSEGNLPFLASPEQFSPADRCSLEVSNKTPCSDWLYLA